MRSVRFYTHGLGLLRKSVWMENWKCSKKYFVVTYCWLTTNRNTKLISSTGTLLNHVVEVNVKSRICCLKIRERGAFNNAPLSLQFKYY